MSEQEPYKSQITADPRKLYVSNLDPTASSRKTEADLHELFDKHGPVLSVSVKRNEKHNKVYAFVLYKEEKHASEALQNLDNEYLGDTKMKVEVQKGSRGQGARREGGDSSNAVTCYRCRKVGHFARQCSQRIESSSHRHDRRSDPKDSKRKHRSRDKKREHSSDSSSSSSDSSSSPHKHRHSKRRHRSRSSSSSSSSSGK